MVYNILNTAALISGANIDVFQSSKRSRIRKPSPPRAAPQAGHSLHGPTQHIKWGVQPSSMPVGAAVPADEDKVNDRDEKTKGYLKDHRYVQRAKADDFFYSLMHSTKHTQKMFDDILQKLRYYHTNMERDTDHKRIFNDTVGEFLFIKLKEHRVTLLAVIDAIQILKQQTDKYTDSTDFNVVAAHLQHWSEAHHYRDCEENPKNGKIEQCMMSNHGRLPKSGEDDCPCCRAIIGSESEKPKCHICVRKGKPPIKLRYDTGQKDNYYQDKLYGLHNDEYTASNILAISGHLASMLAFHAFMHNDLLRPGNNAPIYNVHTTMTYEETLCKGFLTKELKQEEQSLLAPIIQMMTYHELWIRIDSGHLQPDMEEMPDNTLIVQCSAVGAKTIRNPLFMRSHVNIRLILADDAAYKDDFEYGEIIHNIKLNTYLLHAYSTRDEDSDSDSSEQPWSVQMSMFTLSSVYNIYWPCQGDYLTNGKYHKFIFLGTGSEKTANMKIIPKETTLYYRTFGSALGVDSDDDDNDVMIEGDQSYARDNYIPLEDRKNIPEKMNLVVKHKTTNTHSVYRSYRWYALPDTCTYNGTIYGV